MALQILNPRLNKLELGYTTVDSLPTENINPRAIYRIVDKDNGKEYFWRWNDEKWDDMSAKELGEFLITKAGTYRAGGSLTGLENIEAGQSYILKKELPKDALAQMYEMAGEDGVLLKLMDMEGFGPFEVQANVMLTLSDWELVIKKIGEEYLLMSRINETIESTLPPEQLPENYAPVHNIFGDYYATEALELDGRAYPKGWSITASLMLVAMMNANESMMQQLMTPAHYPNLPIRIHVHTTEQWVSPECEELFKSCIYGFWNISEDFYNLVGKMQQLPLSTNDSDQKKYAEEKITKNEGFVMNIGSNSLAYVQEDLFWNPQTEGNEYMFYSLFGLMLMESGNVTPHPFMITMGQNMLQGIGALLNDPFKIIYEESLGAYCFCSSTFALAAGGPSSMDELTIPGYWVVDKEKFSSKIQIAEGMITENKWYVDYRMLNPTSLIMLCPARILPYQPYEAPKDGFNKVDVDIKQTKLYASKNGFYSPKATPVVIGQMNHLKEIYTLEDIQAYTSKATGKSGTSDGYSCMSYIVYGSDSASDILSAMMSSQISLKSFTSIGFHQIVLTDGMSQMNEHLTDGWLYLFNAKAGHEAGLCGVDEDGWYKASPFESLASSNLAKAEHAPNFFVQKDSFNAAPIEVARVLFDAEPSWSGFDSVIVDVPGPKEEETKAITITKNGTTSVTPSSGKVMKQVDVTVNVATANTQTKTVNLTTQGTTQILPDDGYLLSKVTANVNIPTQIKNVTITKNGTSIVEPDSGKVLNKVNITTNIPTQEKNIVIAENGTTEILPDDNKLLSKVSVTVNSPNPQMNGTLVSGDLTDTSSFALANNDLYVFGSGTIDGTILNDKCQNNYADVKRVYLDENINSVNSNTFSQFTNIDEVHTKDLSKWCDTDFADANANPLNQTADLYVNSNKITDLIIPEGTERVGSYAFVGTPKFNSITIPSSITSYGKGAFSRTATTDVYMPPLEYWCSIDFPDASSVPYRGSSNWYINGERVTAASDIIIPEGVTKLGNFFWYSMHDSKKGESLIIPDSVTEIGEYACYNTKFQTIKFGKGVTKLHKNAFYGYDPYYTNSVYITDLSAWMNMESEDGRTPCKKTQYIGPTNFYLNDVLLQDVIIPEEITQIANLKCTSIKSITAGNQITELPDNALRDCSYLNSINLPAVTKVGDYALAGTAISTINLPALTEIGEYAFSGCSALTEIDLPLTQINSYAFQKCPRLTYVNLPNITQLPNRAFLDCSALTTINLPAVTSIDPYSFSLANCTSLTNIILPSVQTFSADGVSGCSKLTTIDLPVATKLGSMSGLSAVTTIILRANTVCTLSGSFTHSYHYTGQVSSTYNPEGLKDGYIYVPAALIEDYKVATNWSTYADQFRAIEDYPEICGTTS